MKSTYSELFVSTFQVTLSCHACAHYYVAVDGDIPENSPVFWDVPIYSNIIMSAGVTRSAIVGSMRLVLSGMSMPTRRVPSRVDQSDGIITLVTSTKLSVPLLSYVINTLTLLRFKSCFTG